MGQSTPGCLPLVDAFRLGGEVSAPARSEQWDKLDALLEQAPPGRVVILTGAGISAESGIPTFRGPEGFWRVGSRNYRPMELATHRAFAELPQEVWAWYLYRRATCRAAAPNPAHRALADLERRLGDRFLLVTQNVDGLHLRAGNTLERTFQIHGNLDFYRCDHGCDESPLPLPGELGDDWARERQLTEGEAALLRCPSCGGWRRPHVLWFDEFYDEDNFRFDSSLEAAATARVLIVVGTSGATNLPDQMVRLAVSRRVPVIVVDVEATGFSRLAERSGGAFLQGSAAEVVPGLARRPGL